MPAAVPVTFTLSVQVPPRARFPPASEMLPEPPVAVTVPPQLPVTPGVAATAKPVVKVSVNDIPVRVTEFADGFVIVKVNGVEVLSGIEVAPNPLLIVGGVAALSMAVAVLPVPPFAELTAPVTFVKLPAVFAVTFTPSVQLAPVATVPPESETLPEPAAAVAVPPQLFESGGVAATTIPVGSVSVKATPVRAAVLAAGLVIVKVSDVVPFTGTPVEPNVLEIDGGASTFKVAEAVLP